MRNNVLTLATGLFLIALTGCVPQDALEADENIENPPNQEQQQQEDVAECGLPIPGAELYVLRTQGAPNEAELEIPGVSSVCLKIETNAASATVDLNETPVATQSDFHNEEQVFFRSVEGLDPSSHTISVRLTGKPNEHYIKVTAHYPDSNTGGDSEIETTDEALLIGQSYVDYHAHLSTFSNWTGAVAMYATPLENYEGVVEAFEVAVKDSKGNAAGYVVLEANELRPLLGSTWGDGPSLAEKLEQIHLSTYGYPHTDGVSRYLWAGLGIMGLEVTLENQKPTVVTTCGPNDCPGFDFNGVLRPLSSYKAEGITADAYKDQRRKYVEEMVQKMILKANSEGKSEPSSALGMGFFGVPGKMSTHASPSGKVLGGAPSALQAICEEPQFPAERYVPGEYSKEELFLLSSLSQTKGEWNGEPECSSGCVPVAATILMNYWDRRYEYLIDGSGNDSVKDQAIYDATEAIRKTLETSCSPTNSGSTPGKNVWKYIDDYIDQRAGAEVGWSTSFPLAGDEGHSALQEQFWPQIERGHPPIIHYFVSTTKKPDPDDESDTTHAGVAYGYIDDGQSDRLSDLIILAKGWETEPVEVLPLDAAGGIKMTSVTPGCYTPSSQEDPCMEFNDITESLEWGRESVETLSCMCVVRGAPDGRYSPKDSVTKAEFLKMVVKLAYPGEQSDLDGVHKEPMLGGFCKDHWASGYINFAIGKDMLGLPIVGNPAYFDADSPISRQEAAYLLSQAGLYSSQKSFATLSSLATCAEGLDEHPYKSPGDNPGELVKEDISSLHLPHILATTSECVFEGYQLDTEDQDPLTPREFRGYKPISRIEAAKVACIARFGVESEKCSLGYKCKPLATVSCP